MRITTGLGARPAARWNSAGGQRKAPPKALGGASLRWRHAPARPAITVTPRGIGSSRDSTKKAPREGSARAGRVQSRTPHAWFSLPCARENFLASSCGEKPSISDQPHCPRGDRVSLADDVPEEKTAAPSDTKPRQCAAGQVWCRLGREGYPLLEAEPRGQFSTRCVTEMF